ncbi:unnamed protein product [Miscanthus lutarioriparius]|uniref:Reverse transcriptase domain-containing protein n=1 Tax=Miscanthus lutarioriparius TaxID=422564 RepID=A0A811QY13_9POAL|nr:unnamed protein product [Miscanthus lutarioriparius]
MGPGFYSAAWALTRGAVMSFLRDFHGGRVDIQRINRALIVFIPKTPAAITPSAFRPVALQNCPVRGMDSMDQVTASDIEIGDPGEWITCKRGVRQGDALSAYLFLLVADILQMLIKSNGAIRHPLSDSPCAVLQYADDTIVVVRAEAESAYHLKRALDSFAAATGLAINFSKSTVTPMNVDEDQLRGMMDTLQCQRGVFPQTYLGLPLSNTKLQLSTFAPLIAKVDRYLAG